MSDYTTVKFGAFMAPYHLARTDPTAGLRRDLDFISYLDDIGISEAWVGEHHSGGIELVASPEIFLAAAIERTKRIKLGLGVVSLPYHHPFLVADRVRLLDHLSQGRIMFGVGPGQLIDDARSMGLDTNESRRKMEESLDVIMRLFDGETVTEETDWYKLDRAYLQLGPYPHAELEIAVTASVSPNGPNLAGRHGASLLSLAATTPAGSAVLAQHWDIATEQAQRHGKTVSRDNWRLVGQMILAETKEEAIKEFEHGGVELMNYLSQVMPEGMIFTSTKQLVDIVNESGSGVIGTPDMAVQRIKELQEASGGFGTFLTFDGPWLTPEATRRSYRLLAEEVAPHFNGSRGPRLKGIDEVMTSDRAAAKATSEAQRIAAERYEASKVK